MAQLIPITTPTRVFEDRTHTIYAVADVPYSQQIVTSSEDRLVRLWDLKTGEVLKKMEGHTGEVMGLAVSRDGQMIATGDENGELIAWQAKTGESLTKLKVHGSAVRSLDFSPDNAFVVTASSAPNDQTVKFWNTKTWTQYPVNYNCGSTVRCVRYARSGVYMLAVATDQDIQIYIGEKLQKKLKGHSHGTLSLAWSPDRTRLLSGGDDHDPSIREWDTSSWTQVGAPWTGHTYKVNSIAINSLGTHAVSASSDNSVRLWQLSDQQTIAIFQHTSSVVYATFSADGTHILSGGYDKKVTSWTAPKGTLQAYNATKEKALEFSPKRQPGSKTIEFDSETEGSDSESLKAVLTTESFDYKPLQAVLTTGSPHSKSLKAVSTTESPHSKSLKAVSTTESSDFKFPQAVSTTGSSNYKSLQAVATTGSFDSKSLQAVSTTGNVDSKSPQAVSTIGSFDSKSLQAVSTTGSFNSKSLQAVSTTGSFDSKSPQAVLTIESTNFKSPHFDSSQAGLTTENSNFKFPQAVSTTGSSNHKSLQSVLTTTSFAPKSQQSPLTVQSLSNEQSVSKAEQFITKSEQSVSKTLVITTDELLAITKTIRIASITGDLATAEKVLTQEITVDAKNFTCYANRSFVMARKLDWENAFKDANKSLAIRTSLAGYIAKGIALCGKQLVEDARTAFDLGFTFTQGNMDATVFLYLIKAIALFNASRHKEAMIRVDQLSADPSADPLACGVVVASLRVQLGTSALNGARHTEAIEHLTAAVKASTFLAKSAAPAACEAFTVLFGWDIEALWETSNRQLILALLGAGRLGEAFESYRFAMNASDEATKTSLHSWILTLSL